MKPTREKAISASISLLVRQVQFLEKNPDFDISKFVKEELDHQIRQIDREFLSEEEIRGDNGIKQQI